MVNLFGAGFIGGNYAKLFPCTVNEKYDLIPHLDNVNNLLYLISTVDNYHLKSNPYIDIDTNLTLLIRVLENFRLDPRSKDVVFNFASSWFVYGEADLPAHEKSYCNPIGFYSITKRTAEQLLISYCNTYNLKYRILRFANVLGPGDKKVSKKKNALTYIINEMKHNRPVELHSNGDFVRDYMHVNDVCSAVDLVMKRGDTNSIYNIGNGTPVKFSDIINHIISLGSTSSITNICSPVQSMYMDTTKLKLLGYSPTYSINDIIEELFY